jgi:cell division protein ZapA
MAIMDSQEKRSVRVAIYNQSYTLTTTGDAAEIEELAHSVDDLMRNIAARAGNVDSTRAAVLTCLHLADKLRTLERENAEHKRKVRSKHQKLVGLLDQLD